MIFIRNGWSCCWRVSLNSTCWYSGYHSSNGRYSPSWLYRSPIRYPTPYWSRNNTGSGWFTLQRWIIHGDVCQSCLLGNFESAAWSFPQGDQQKNKVRFQLIKLITGSPTPQWFFSPDSSLVFSKKRWAFLENQQLLWQTCILISFSMSLSQSCFLKVDSIATGNLIINFI